MADHRKKRATMKDVAELAGVTQPTVSYVVNQTMNISQEVKDRVWAAIEELNYNPNVFARSLKTNRSNSIGILIPDISNSYYAAIIDQLEINLRKAGYVSIVATTRYDEENELESIRTINGYNVDAFIVCYQLRSKKGYDLLNHLDCPVVVLEGSKEKDDLIHIWTDNLFGGQQATEYLLKQGLRKIAYVGQTSHSEALFSREQGYRQAMSKWNLSETDYIFRTKSPLKKWTEGMEIGKNLLEAKVEGVIVSSDVISFGILQTFFKSGISIPKDISLISYDDIPMAGLFLPALSTMKQPIKKMCSYAVEALVVALTDKEVEDKIFKPTLILRETTNDM